MDWLGLSCIVPILVWLEVSHAVSLWLGAGYVHDSVPLCDISFSIPLGLLP